MSSQLAPVPSTVIEAVPDARAAADQLLRQIAASVDLLPALPPPDPDDRYHLRTLTVLWLLGLGQTSRHGYFLILADWLAWCERHDLDPCRARRADTDAWKAAMTAQKRGDGNVITYVPASRATIAKRLSVVSSWYKYLSSNEIATTNPAAATTHPSPANNPAPDLAADEAAHFLTWLVKRAERLGTEAAWRDAAQLHLMFATGLRVTAACLPRFEDISFRRGHCVLRYRKKSRDHGEDWAHVPLTPEVLAVQRRYWAVRAQREGRDRGRPIAVDELTGLLYVSTPHPYQPDRVGGRAMNQKHVQRRLRTLARQAGLAGWRTLTPHSARGTVATLSLESGASLRQVQDLLGHASIVTTQRYDHARHTLDTSPVWSLGALLRQHGTPPATDHRAGNDDRMVGADPGSGAV